PPLRPPLQSTLFPYTTLFRSIAPRRRLVARLGRLDARHCMAADLIAVDRDPFDPSVDLRDVNVPMTLIRRAIEHDVTGGHGFFADRKSTRLNSSHLGISYAVF